MNEVYKQRIRKLQNAMSEGGLDGVVLMPSADLLYFTGWEMTRLTERPTLVFIKNEGRIAVFTGRLEVPNASRIFGEEAEFYSYVDGENPDDALRNLVESIGLEAGVRLGTQYNVMRIMEYTPLFRLTKFEAVDSEDLLGQIRMVKDGFELDAMVKAAEIAERALAKVAAEFIRPGVTEREIMNQLMVEMFELGSGPLPKVPIVSSGARTASPHTTTTDRVLEDGDILMIDTGASWSGYASDITRTFGVGKGVDPEFERVYNVVAEAVKAATDGLRPGIQAQEVDSIARSVIEDAGYGEYFIHRVGHGLGMEGHEYPYLASGNELSLPAYTTMTIEPGIYLPGRGGVRIEDNVAVSPNGGGIVLNTYPLEWQILG